MALPPFAAVTTADELSADIKAIDQNSQAGLGTGTAYSITLAPGATLTETANLTAINLSGADTLDIDGGPTGATLDGGNLYRGFFVYQGAVTIENLTIQNAVAKGGVGSQGGGGGAGLGGGLFVANDPANDAFPAAVTLNNVTFTHDQAIGGAGGSNSGTGAGGSGGGLGGAGAMGYGGGGGIGDGTSTGGSGSTDSNGAPGIVAGAQGGGTGSDGTSDNPHGTAGGADGGGGGGGSQTFSNSASGGTATAFGGGGGGGIAGASGTVNGGGAGGFGGGGGGGNYGGNGGFGGGGGGGYFGYGGAGGFGGGGGAGSPGGLAGFGGGDGATNSGSDRISESGGGGLGAGGDVFVQQGALLTITGGKLSGGSVTGGTSPGNAGQALGSGIFIQGNESITLGTGAVAGQITEIDDVIADENNGSAGLGQIVIDGAGTVLFKATNSNLGGTTIKSGTLDIEAASPFNRGDASIIDFAPNSNATLKLGPVAFANSENSYLNGVDDFSTGDTIDLRGFTYVAGQTTATFERGASATYLMITDGSTTDYLRYDGPDDSVFATTDDGQRGTDIMLMCFTTGTRIRVAREGEALDLLVQDLAVGDIAVTASGALRPIHWIGQRTIECAAQAIPSDAWPVRILPGAFGVGACGNNLPERELRLSPGHPVLVGEGDAACLVPIMCLINGTSIERVPVERVTYWHIELDEHDILYAEGLPAESFLDFGNRPWFGPDGEAHALANPDFVVPGLGARCRPVAIDGPLVEAERRRLDDLFEMSQAVAGAWPEFDEVFAQVSDDVAIQTFWSEDISIVSTGTLRVPNVADGALSNRNGFGFSPDGRHVGFASNVRNLVPADTAATFAAA